MSNNLNKRGHDSDEDDELCPMCDTPIRYVHINFRKMMRMCRNANCEFSFGNYDIEKVIDDILSSYEAAPASRTRASTASRTRASTASRTRASTASSSHVDSSSRNRSKKRKFDDNTIINELEKSLRSLDNMSNKLEKLAKGVKKRRKETNHHTNIVNNEERQECMNLPGTSGTSGCGGKLEINIEHNRNKSSTNVENMINPKDESSED